MSAQFMVDEKYYTISEIAEIFRIDRRSVRKLIDQGQIEAIKVLNEYRISQRAIEAYIRRQSLPLRDDGQGE
jgi:excisionase family DNA binding protein